MGSLRGIREFDSCLSAGIWVEVFAQVSRKKMHLSQLQNVFVSIANCILIALYSPVVAF